jgi:transcriptional regulator with XRE-family HTH domain
MAKNSLRSKKRKKIDGFKLGERVSYLRIQRGLTQTTLAKRANVSQSTIAQIESGKKDPSVLTLEEIALALDVHVSILFAGDDVHVFDMKKLKRKYKKVEDLNPTIYFGLGKVIRYAREIGLIEE